MDAPLRSWPARLLLRLQPHLRTDVMYLARGGFWLVLGQAASAAMALLLSVALAALVTKEAFGTYKYVLSIAGLLSLATLPQMIAAVTQSVARGFEGDLTATLRTRWIWSALAVLAAAVLAAYEALQGNGGLAVAFLIAGACVPAFYVLQQYEGFLFGRKLFGVSARYAALAQAVSFAALLAAAFLWKSVPALLLAYFGSKIVTAALFFRRTVATFKPNGATDPATASYGKHLTLMSAIGAVADAADGLLIYHVLGPVPLATYVIACGPPDQIKTLFSHLDTMAFPKLANADDRAVRAGIGRKFLVLFLAAAAVIAAYALVAPTAYRLLFPAYADAAAYSQVFALGLLNVAFLPAGIYLRAKRKIREQYSSNLFFCVFQVVALAVGVTQWGLWGAVVARVLSRYAGALANVWHFYRSKSA